MMLLASAFKDYLKTVYPAVTFYAGAINKNDNKCVGIYPKGRQPFFIAAGGIKNTTTWYLPLSLLIHWTENTSECEEMARILYEYFLTVEDVVISGIRIIHFDLLDACPVDLDRDNRNICEIVIRLNVIYENRISS